MINSIPKTILAFFLCLIFTSSFADIKLPSVITSNMVLQRDTPIHIWGWADKKEAIAVIFSGDTVTTKANKKGEWAVDLPERKSGGPFELIVKGKNEIILDNILMGDVWICSGQSNMEWQLSASNNAEEEIENSSHPRVRLLTVQKNKSTTPLDTCVSKGWEVCGPQSSASFSAVGYFFGRKLNDDLDVPIGLINTSWGGTNVETWTSAKSISEIEGFEKIEKRVNEFDEASMIAETRAKVESITGPLPEVDLGLKDGKAPWAQNDLDVSSWQEMKLPQLWEQAGLEGLNGIVWFRKTIVLESQDLLNDVEVNLGTIDDSDITYFNGVEIGRQIQAYNKNRIYKVDKSLLKTGKNVITVRVEDAGGGGGIYGDKENMYANLTNKKIDLSGAWKYKIGVGDFSYSLHPNSLPGLLYNAMIYPLIPMKIKGAIWYQGESNAGRAHEYRKLFPNMINNWRESWNIGDFPFLFVQLANYRQPKPEPGPSDWAELREAQTMTLSLPNTGMATIIDIGEADDIHPRNKQDVGNRLAIGALKVAYGEEVSHSGPTFDRMIVKGKKVILKFQNVGSGFYLKNKYGYVNGFSIAGADKKFYWSKAEIVGEDIVLSCSEVEKPVAVRYGWADNPEDLNLYNLEGLPAVPFRTDDWDMITKGKSYMDER